MKKKLIVLMALLLALTCTACTADAPRRTAVTVSYAADRATVFENPFIGQAVWANLDDEELEQPFTLVYANLSWADFEPSEGVYDFASFETANRFDHWRAAGKRIILRLVMDYPTSEKHADIPQWLYDKTGDGGFYDIEYGKGYCPNYENETLIAAHAKAVAALGERYDADPFVAYVELGSLGHWGEWHVHEDAGSMPAAAVRERYAAAYAEAFPQTFLLLRRPFDFKSDRAYGLFNDSSASLHYSAEWLDWIQNGGEYLEDPQGLKAMPDAWKTVPVGGELASEKDTLEYLQGGLEETLNLFMDSHTSWVGPHCFATDVKKGSELQGTLDELVNMLGYRLRVAEATVQPNEDGTRALSLRWRNDGLAPFYFGWQAALKLVSPDGDTRIMSLDMALLDVLPDADFDVTALLPEGDYTVSVGVLDPETGDAGVSLAMNTAESGRWYELLTVTDTTPKGNT